MTNLGVALMEKRLKDVLADHVKDWATLALAGMGR